MQRSQILESIQKVVMPVIMLCFTHTMWIKSCQELCGDPKSECLHSCGTEKIISDGEVIGRPFFSSCLSENTLRGYTDTNEKKQFKRKKFIDNRQS